jgi:4-oxalocrotonate tautomerase
LFAHDLSENRGALSGIMLYNARTDPPRTDQRKKEMKMPEVYVHAVRGRTPEQKKALMKDITDAVVKHFNAAADAVVVSIIETEPTAKSKGGVPFSERR